MDDTPQAVPATGGALLARQEHFRVQAGQKPQFSMHDAATEAQRLVTWLRVMTRPPKGRGCWYCGSDYGLEAGWRTADDDEPMPMCREHANLTRVGQLLIRLDQHKAAEMLAQAAGFGCEGFIPPPVQIEPGARG